MKGILALFLIFVHLFSVSELHEVFKIPVLIQHYIEHKNLDHQLSFISFIQNHYTNDTIEHDTDTKLPFKNHSDISGSTFLATFFPIEKKDDLFNFESILSKSKIIPTEFILSSSHLSTIWQPPKWG